MKALAKNGIKCEQDLSYLDDSVIQVPFSLYAAEFCRSSLRLHTHKCATQTHTQRHTHTHSLTHTLTSTMKHSKVCMYGYVYVARQEMKNLSPVTRAKLRKLVMSLDNTTEFQSAHRPVLLQTDDGGASPPELADAVVSRDTKIIPSKEIIARRLQALREAKAQQTGAIKDDSASLPAKIESKSVT